MNSTSRTHLGSGLALFSAMVFALNVTTVPLIYAGGGNIHAVNFVRPFVFLACLLIWLPLRGVSLRLPSLQQSGAVALGGFLCIEFYAMHSAVKYIPVGLAILIMYTYPIIVALLSGVLGRGRISMRFVFVLCFVFIGLALALSTPVGVPDWRGIGPAVLAALGMCGIVMISERTTKGQDDGVVMFYVTLTASAVMLTVYLSGIPVIWPHTTTGLTALFVSSACYVVATSLLFVSISMIGPVRFAVIDNTAPVWATLLALVLLGEQLALTQWIGMLLVIGGVIAVQFVQAPAARPQARMQSLD